MSTQILAALVSGVVALSIAGGSWFLSWVHDRRERNKWQTEVKVAYALELHKARLESYPEVFRILSALSTLDRASITAETAGNIARELNKWFYSTGGMCADATTRGAILGLRKCCIEWAQTGKHPHGLISFRNLAMSFLRRDLDIGGLESYEFDTDSTLLSKLQNELTIMESKSHRNTKRDTYLRWRGGRST